jgi:hypothetical protein
VQQPQGEQNLRELDSIYKDLEAPDTGSGHPPIIDLNPAFGGPADTFNEYLSGPHGTQVQVRTPDGTHLTLAGAEVFGRVIARDVQPVSPFRQLQS